jgi:hypothetical protein
LYIAGFLMFYRFWWKVISAGPQILVLESRSRESNSLAKYTTDDQRWLASCLTGSLHLTDKLYSVVLLSYAPAQLDPNGANWQWLSPSNITVALRFHDHEKLATWTSAIHSLHETFNSRVAQLHFQVPPKKRCLMGGSHRLQTRSVNRSHWLRSSLIKNLTRNFSVQEEFWSSKSKCSADNMKQQKFC